jgi:hypothetical protein
MLKDNVWINNMVDNVIWYYNDIYTKQKPSDDIDYIISSRDLACRVDELLEDTKIVSQCHHLKVDDDKTELINKIIGELKTNKHVQDIMNKQSN